MGDRLEREQEVCCNIYLQQTMRSSTIKKKMQWKIRDKIRINFRR